MTMRKNIQRVRRDIQRRRQLKNRQPSMRNYERIEASFPNEQDKHGEVQLYPKHVNYQRRSRSLFSPSFFKAFLSLVVFLLVFLVFQTNVIQTSAPKHWLETHLTKEFPFATVNAWYNDRFGRPLAFNPQFNTNLPEFERQALPVIGEVSEPFHLNGEGIKISSDVATPVKAWEDGIVIFSGNDRSTKKTVTIQHADHSETSYGFLSTIDVHLYQYIATGQVIGMFHPEEGQKEIYFSIEKDDSFIDPAQVIYVDER